jgi:hypothetical protein
MTAITAQLLVANHTYPIRLATYEFTQATGPRGRVTERVRMGLVYLTLDIPADDFLVSWAATPNKPLAGQVVFMAAQGGMALETLGWETGQCVGYQEEFVAGDQAAGSYVCHLTIAAPKLTIQPGGPAAYSSPQVALVGVPALVVPTVGPPATPLVLPTVEELAATAGEKLVEGLAAAGSVVLIPLALTLGLILASTIPTAANDTLPPPQLPPIDPNLLRLQYLLAKQATGTLTSQEGEELLALLAKVKGIHLQRLQDLPILPSSTPNANARPGGFVTRINPEDEVENQRALRRENESADILAKAGYRVVQNPTVAGTTRNPDYLVEGRVFDCYAPTNSKPRAIATTLEGKIKKGQAQRFILNLEDSAVEQQALREQFTQYPVPGLEEIIIIKQGQVVPFIP